MSIDDMTNGSPMFQQLGEKSLQTWRPERLAGLYASIIMYWKDHDLHPTDEENLHRIHVRLMSMSLTEKRKVYQILQPGEVRDIYTSHVLSIETQN